MPHNRTGGNQPPGDPAEELLAMIAHELRRPLTALLGALATVQQRGPALATAQQQELLAVAHRQATQLQRLLDQLLTAAGLDHPQADMNHRSLQDVAALAQEAGIAARLAHPDHPVTIEVAGPLLVHTDPLAITRILGNLLDNAATHSPPGAPIRLVAGRDDAQAVLAVQDQGPGIPPEERGRMFERYARLDRPTHPPAGGLGLGLYIAQRLAGANCGELHVTDAPSGRGTWFELRLPLAPPAPDLGPTTPTSGQQPPPGRRRPDGVGDGS